MKLVVCITLFLTLLSLALAFKKKNLGSLARGILTKGKLPSKRSSYPSYKGSVLPSSTYIKPRSYRGSSYSVPKSTQNPKCHQLPKLVCKDVEMEVVEYQIETVCETTDVEKCVNVTESTVETQEVEECRDQSVGFRRVQKFEIADVCVDFSEIVCKNAVTTSKKPVLKQECKTQCTQSCQEKTRHDCSSITLEEGKEEFVRECRKQLVTQCVDDCQDCGHNSRSRLVNCTRGVDGRDVCPTPQVCEQKYLEKCDDPKSVWRMETVTRCNCREVIEEECKPVTQEVCTDVTVLEDTLAEEEQCQEEQKTKCVEQSVPNFSIQPDESCAGQDLIDPDCVTYSNPVCSTRQKSRHVSVDREQCFTVPCEQCHDMAVEVPTVKVESVCTTEETTVCEEDMHSASTLTSEPTYRSEYH